MSARDRADAALTTLLSLVFLPGRLIEEGVHALVSLACGARVAVEIDPVEGSAVTRAEFREHTPQWAIAAAHLAPEAVAAVAGVVVIGWWVVAGPVWLPATMLDWVLLSLLGAQYLAIAIPSRADSEWGDG